MKTEAGQGKRVTVNAFAKVNLFLDVFNLRADGYHDVVMVNQSISLSDRLIIILTDKPGIHISCDALGIPSDERNLAYKAARTFMNVIGREFGISIHIEKRIPMEAGLAGGSADAAGTLVGLNALINRGLSPQQIAEIGAMVGSDVPFCVIGGSAWVTGRGEFVESLKPPRVDWSLVLISPKAKVSTGGAYKKLDANPHRRHPDAHAFRNAFLKGAFDSMCNELYNAFETVILPESPEIAAAKECLYESGAGGALMTGSGSNVFGLFKNRPEAEAGLAKVLKEGWKAQVVGLESNGVKMIV